MPDSLRAGQVSGAATANSVNCAPNQLAESRVETGANSRSVSSSIAAIGRPTRAQAPRCIAVQSGGDCCARTLSTFGLSATSQVARPQRSAYCDVGGDSAAATGVARDGVGPRRSARDAAAASTRWASHSGTAAAAASGLAYPGGGRSASTVTPNAMPSRRWRSAASARSIRSALPASAAGITANPSSEAASIVLQAATSSTGFSRRPQITLTTVATTPAAVTTGAAATRAPSAWGARVPCSPATASSGSSRAPQVSVTPSKASSAPRWARAWAFA